MQSVSEHPHRALWEQSGREESTSETKTDHVSSKEEFALYRSLCEIKLQFREAIPLLSQEAHRVSPLNPTPPPYDDFRCGYLIFNDVIT